MSKQIIKDVTYLHQMYNATSTGKNDELETYENWLERQLLSRINIPPPKVTAEETLRSVLLSNGEPIEKINSTSFSHHTYSYETVIKCIEQATHFQQEKEVKVLTEDTEYKTEEQKNCDHEHTIFQNLRCDVCKDCGYVLQIDA